MLDLLFDKPQLMAVFLSYPLFLWFLFISFAADKKYFKQSLVMTIAWGLYCCCFIFGLFDPLSYVEMLQVLILIDIATGLILVTDMFISKYSCKLALTIAFAVLCHSMILLHKITGIQEIKIYTVGFYTYYDQLLATVGILQLLVSYDDGFSSGIKGFARRFRSLPVRYRLFHGLSVHYIQNIFISQKRES